MKKLILPILTSASLTLPIAVCSSCSKTKTDNKEIKKEPFIKIGNKKFYSLEEVHEYLKSQNVYITAKQINKLKYKLNSQNMTFENRAKLNEYLTTLINSKEVTTELDFDKLLKYKEFDKSISKNGLKFIDFDSAQDNVTIYRGINDSAYLNKTDAIDSYFNIGVVYPFGNKIYSSIEAMRKEIEPEIDKINSQQDLTDFIDKYNLNGSSEILKFANGNEWALPTDFLQLSNTATLTNQMKNELTNIIVNNSTAYVMMDTPFGQKAFSIDEILKNSNLSQQFLKDLSIFNVIKADFNYGKSSFIVDSSKNDENNLFGNYIHSSTNDSIEKFNDSNREMWKKTKNEGSSNVSLNEEAQYVNKFFSYIFDVVMRKDIDKKIINGQDASAEKEILKNNISVLNNTADVQALNKLNNLLKSFKIEGNSISLYDRLNEIIKEIKNGKRGSLFNEIPIIYIAAISNMVKYEAPYELVSAFNEYYRKFLNYFDKICKNLLGDLYKNKDGQPIKMYRDSQMNGFDLNLNTDLNAFINMFANSPYVLSGAKAIMLGINNANSTTGMVEFNSNFVESADLDNQSLSLCKNLFDKFSLKQNAQSPYYFDLKQNKVVEDANNNTNEIISALVGFVADSVNSATESLNNKYISDLNWLMSNTDRAQEKEYTIKANNIKHWSVESSNSYELAQKMEKLDYTNVEDLKSINYQYNEQNIKINSSLSVKMDEESSTEITVYKNNEEWQQRKAKSIKANKLLQGASAAQNTIRIFGDCMNFLNTAFNDKDELNHTENVLSSLKSIVNGVFSFAPQNPYVEIFKTVINLGFELALQAIGHISKINYEFSDNEVKEKYIWDGGLLKTQWWGIKKTNLKTIKDAKLLKPVRFMPAFYSTEYLFDGKIYHESEKVKMYYDILNKLSKYRNIFIENLNSQNQNKYKIFVSPYNLSGLSENDITSTKVKNRDYFDSKDAIESVITDFQTKQEANHFLSGIMMNKKINSLGVSQSTNIDEVKRLIKNYIGYSIKPIVYTLIPKAREDKSNNVTMPLDQYVKISNISDLYISTDEAHKRIEQNNNTSNMLIYDLNDTSLANIPSRELDQKLINWLKIQFEKIVGVDYKIVSKFSYIKNKNFSTSKLATVFKIYITKDKDNNYYYFFNQDDALKILESKNFCELSAEKYSIDEYSYSYEEFKFNNLESLITYLEAKDEKTM